MEEAFFNTAISPRLGQTDQALERSQRGPASHSSLPQSLLQLGLTRNAFGSCSFVAFGASFPCRLQLAGVASHLTLVGNTGELVPTQGSWVAEVFHWRVALPESAEKQVLESPRTSGDQARRTTELRNPELSGDQGRARLVVLACETGGRWSEEAHDFLRQLARARARWEPPVIRQGCPSSMVSQVVHCAGVLRCSGVRAVVAGAPWRAWRPLDLRRHLV